MKTPQPVLPYLPIGVAGTDKVDQKVDDLRIGKLQHAQNQTDDRSYAAKIKDDCFIRQNNLMTEVT